MSEPRIPLTLQPLNTRRNRGNQSVERFHTEIRPHIPWVLALSSGPKAKAHQDPKPPRRQRPQADPDTSTLIEHTLHSLQTFGFTPPSNGRYLMAPKEFQVIVLLETQAVAAVVWEMLLRTIGWEGDGPRCRGACVHLTIRHFVRAKVLSRAQAERGIKRALAMG
jgi:hypothetical protein